MNTDELVYVLVIVLVIVLIRAYIREASYSSYEDTIDMQSSETLREIYEFQQRIALEEAIRQHQTHQRRMAEEAMRKQQAFNFQRGAWGGQYSNNYGILFDQVIDLSTITLKEVKEAYRKKAKMYHPDVGGDPKKFRELTEAYETLKLIAK